MIVSVIPNTVYSVTSALKSGLIVPLLIVNLCNVESCDAGFVAAAISTLGMAFPYGSPLTLNIISVVILSYVLFCTAILPIS